MTLKDWADLAQLTLVPAILISLAGLWYNLDDSRRHAVEVRNAQWQKVIIYAMLDNGPLNLSEIRQELVTQATAFGLTKLGLERVGDISIRAALLDLIGQHAVVRVTAATPNAPDVYVATRAQIADPMEQMRAFTNLRMEEQKRVDAVRGLIEQNNLRFNEAELGTFIRQYTKLDNKAADDLSMILAALEVQGLIGRGADQKLFRMFRNPPPPPRDPVRPAA